MKSILINYEQKNTNINDNIHPENHKGLSSCSVQKQLASEPHFYQIACLLSN